MKALHVIPVAILLFSAQLPAQNSTIPSAPTTPVGVNCPAPSLSRQFRPGQVLVKLKDSETIHVSQAPAKPGVSVQSTSIDRILSSVGATKMEQLMPVSGAPLPATKSNISSIDGTDITNRDLRQLYLISFDATQHPDAQKVAEMFQDLDEVEFAEPNYLVFAQSSNSNSAAIPGFSKKKTTKSTSWNPSDFNLYTSEPMYSQQWGPEAISLPYLWSQPTILGHRPVIAILDTGVDTTHPDLAGNLWTNVAEAEGAEGQDDDQNGYPDDIHGWDCVNQTGRLGDWNGHGTHCAGIAAAVGTNGIGITGGNPDALIMPVTVLQSDGIGDVGSIIKGIEYAMKNHADVISMSLGGYTYSMAEELALAKAYHSSVIVAAAGNDGRDITTGHKTVVYCCGGAPMFPGAFTFVLGVQASQQWPIGQNYCVTTNRAYNPYRANYSNLDCDGVFSEFDEEKLYNYEIMAPGSDILSTYPGGRYKIMNGTSMATPLVAGAVSRLLQTKEYSSKELLFGDLINTSDATTGNIDVKAAYDVSDESRTPVLMLVSYQMTDSLGDNDGRFDAGETIEFYPILRNTWGTAQNIRCTLQFQDNEDTTRLEILENNVSFGKPLHSYGKEVSLNPIRFKVADDCVDGRRIKLQVLATCDNSAEGTVNQKFTISVENGVELNGIVEKNTTLKAGVHYIVNKSLAIPQGITLSIEAGTTIKLHDNVEIRVADGGRIVARGTKDAPITFTKGDLSQGYINRFDINSSSIFQYVRFQGLASTGNNLFTSGRFTDCVFEDCDFGFYGNTGITTTRCNIINNTGYIGFDYGNTHKNTNIIGNRTTNVNPLNGYQPSFNTKYPDLQACNVYGNYSDYMEAYSNVNCVTETPTVVYNDYPSYFGASTEACARVGVTDYLSPLNNDYFYTSFGKINLSNMKTAPVSEAHGVVWKVLVNGKDAQDEYDEIVPLGIGTHRIDVYFNRQMDTTIQPWVSMGVRPPYTQNMISDSTSWSADGKIWTGYLNLTPKSAFDGINRFFVSDAEDMEHFVIPVERTRFNVPVSVSGSMSAGFQATSGLGKVTLEWNAVSKDDIEDQMGYNIYRYTLDENLIPSDTSLINDNLVEDTTYTDYDVVPGQTYFYYYRVLRSTLDSSDPSSTVAATPLTAKKGDSNGSMEVNVADVVTTIAWLTDQNPQPFIFEAADVNSDETINILDVVGTINIFLPNAQAHANLANPQAVVSIEDGILYIESDVALGGIQISLKGNGEMKALQGVYGMEQLFHNAKEGITNFFSYSLCGRSVLPGKQAILEVGSDIEITSILLSCLEGQPVSIANKAPTALEEVEVPYRYRTIYDIFGRKVSSPNGPDLYIIDGQKVLVK